MGQSMFRINSTLLGIIGASVLLGGAFLGPIPYAFADDDDDQKKRLKELIAKIREHRDSDDDKCKENKKYEGVCDRERPKIDIKEPDNRDKLPAGLITFELKAKDKGSGLAKVQLRINDGAFQDATLISGDKWELVVDLEPGNYKATAKATDKVGNTKRDSIKFKVVREASALGTSEITIRTVDSSGEIFGKYTVLKQDGVKIETDFSVSTFTVNNGETYNVGVRNFGDFKFVKWQDTGSHKNNRDFAISSDTEYFAQYRNITDPPLPGTSVLTVITVNSSGDEIPGKYTRLLQNGVLLEATFSPAIFTVNDGETYEVKVSNFRGVNFNQWGNASTDNPRTFSITSDDTFTAFYLP